jgi:hypothetical protein
MALMLSSKLLALHFTVHGVLSFMGRLNIKSIHVSQPQQQEFVLIPPLDLCSHKLFFLNRWRGRVCNLRNEVRRGGFCDAIDQNAYQRNLDEDKEANSKAE